MTLETMLDMSMNNYSLLCPAAVYYSVLFFRPSDPLSIHTFVINNCHEAITQFLL